MANVRVEGLTKRYGQVVAVNNVDVEIKEGSLTAILGPSGCGKTTLLRCIAGLLTPDAGKVFIGKEDVTNVPPFKRNLGMVFQRPSMFPHMTAYKNIAWALQLRGWPKDKISSRVTEMLKLVHLEGMEERAFSQLSGGQAQRVVIARALAPQPDILLLDEPLSSLDAKLRDQLKFEIAEIHRKTGCTTIMVTHDQSEALTVANNVLLMFEGKIVQEGDPLDVYRNPKTLFSADFIGTNNMMPAKVVEVGADKAIVQLDGATTRLEAVSFPADIREGTPVWACVRADDVDIVDANERNRYSNVAEVDVQRSSLTGGMVIVEGKLKGIPFRIHAGGSGRFELLDVAGSTISCAMPNVSLIHRDQDDSVLKAQ
ncbi:MAG: ABC transporter ATP-binding protein [Chloroflexi bacterium]|nr:ABC transporter ATP-binding protein [Chloroflexota bacterium]